MKCSTKDIRFKVISSLIVSIQTIITLDKADMNVKCFWDCELRLCPLMQNHRGIVWRLLEKAWIEG